MSKPIKLILSILIALLFWALLFGFVYLAVLWPALTLGTILLLSLLGVFCMVVDFVYFILFK